MARCPTPIADELFAMGAEFTARAGAGRPLAGLDLLRRAEQLQALARAAAPVERFHAELVADAAEQELMQCISPCGLLRC